MKREKSKSDDVMKGGGEGEKRRTGGEVEKRWGRGGEEDEKAVP